MFNVNGLRQYILKQIFDVETWSLVCLSTSRAEVAFIGLAAIPAHMQLLTMFRFMRHTLDLFEMYPSDVFLNGVAQPSIIMIGIWMT